ncbi:MAG: hypothetical protein ACPIOQ_82720 [Promethearchaeia archaeon]
MSDGSGVAEEEPAAAWRSFALVLEVRDSRVRERERERVMAREFYLKNPTPPGAAQAT